MREFNDYFKIILEHEGGFVNHPADPGGATKYGVSLLFLKDTALIDGDIDRDGDIDQDDIIALTIEDSERIYKKFFWDRLHLEGLDLELLKLHLFDHGVNAGTRTAVKLLQKVLGIEDDGSLGPTTTRIANRYIGDLVEKYKTARQNYYLLLIDKNPKLEVFKKGWLNRIETTKF